MAGVLFGTTFVVMKDAVEDVEPVPFLAVRFLIGAAVLVPFVGPAFGQRSGTRPRLGVVRAGAACGLALGSGYILQTVGLQYTSSSVSAFITYLLVVIVPVISAVALRRRPSNPTVVGVVVSATGLFLLTGADPSLGRGELLTLGCAVAFAAHIVLLAAYVTRFDPVALSAVQLLIVGLALAGPGALLGGYRFTAAAWVAAAYTGVAVSALALLFQMWGQQRVGPTRAALLLMVEPVAAAGLGHLRGERLAAVGIAGAALILAGIAVAEVATLRRGAPAAEASSE